MSNSPRLSSKGLKPHSYADNFSTSSALVEMTNDATKIMLESRIQSDKNRNTEK